MQIFFLLSNVTFGFRNHLTL